ncbi:hypothetical protein E0X81_12020 [Halomonas sp. GDM18]|nr:hypothetical protein E0X81_12020 [Halomonas sp. GDM18]
MKSVLICTKPIQFFNFLNINSKDNTITDVLILESFSGANEFSRTLASLIENDVYLLSDEAQIINHVRERNYTRLYINWTVDLFFNSLRKYVNSVTVLDDGIYSYTRVIPGKTKPVKHFVRQVIRLSQGVYPFIGFGNKIDEYFLYYPEEHKKKFPFLNFKRRSFENSFLENLAKHQNLIDTLYPDLEKDIDIVNNVSSDIYILVTSHSLDICFSDIFRFLGDDKILYIKPHPHLNSEDIKTLEAIFSTINIVVLYGSYPLESLLLKLMVHSKSISLLHYNSSIAKHLISSPFFNLINLSKKS